MPIIELLAIKGLIFLIKGLGGASVMIFSKAVAAWGLSAAISGALAIGAVVGGILWTRERIGDLHNGIKALEQGNGILAAKNFAKLAVSAHIHVDFLPDTVKEYLLKANVTEYKAAVVAQAIKEMEGDIVNELRKLKNVA